MGDRWFDRTRYRPMVDRWHDWENIPTTRWSLVAHGTYGTANIATTKTMLHIQGEKKRKTKSRIQKIPACLLWKPYITRESKAATPVILQSLDEISTLPETRYQRTKLQANQFPNYQIYIFMKTNFSGNQIFRELIRREIIFRRPSFSAKYPVDRCQQK